MPDFDFTRLTSPALIEPFSVHILAELEPVTGSPDCPLV